jgi:pilus assembly protein Flp/PilA
MYNCGIPEVVSGKFKKKGVKTMLFSPKEKGQGLVEYALILVLVAIVVIAALMILGPIIGNVFSKINSSLSSF